MKNWIWLKDGSPSENVVGNFRHEFKIHKKDKTLLKISADSRYSLYINGNEVGQGPIRSTLKRWFYDEYDITNYLDIGENIIAIRVWDYGFSTYQTIANCGGLVFEVIKNESVISCSGKNTKSILDKGIKSKTVKRNVNLGFMEYFDANKSDFEWIKKDFDDSSWNESSIIDDVWGKLNNRQIKFYDHQEINPQNIYSIKEVKPNIQNVSVNLRKNMFPDRLDANANIFSGFLGFYIESSSKQSGYINFPNNKWNGVHGDFKIDDIEYKVDRTNRKTAVNLNKGKQLFIMNLSAKFDDLYAHMEFHFKEELIFTEFFTIGPTKYIINYTDGFKKIYGGLENFEKIENTPDNHNEIYNAAPKLSKYNKYINELDMEYVFFDEYILSLVENKDVLEERKIVSVNNSMLHGNTLSTILNKTKDGNDLEIVLDFYDMYVGNISFSLNAPKNTIMDIYGFENMFEDEIDYTFGLNNGIRYVCKEGYQNYNTLTRMGFRYLMLTFRNVTDDIEIFNIKAHQKSHPISRSGSFRSNDYLLNKIHEISRRTHLLCSEDTFTDSPTYEQAFWSGDAQVSAMVNAFYFGESELVKNCIMQVPLSREHTKLLSALMPTDWVTAIPLWTMNWIITIDEYIYNTGDESVILKLYDQVKETLDYYINFIREDGSFYINAWNMIDWAAMDIHNNGVMTAQQGVLAHCFRILKKMAIKLNIDDANKYDNVINSLLSYINDKMWIDDKDEFADGYTDEAGLSKTVGMQTHIMLYLYDLIIDKDKKEIIRKKLIDKPSHWLDVGSPFMLFYLFEILEKQGMTQRILDEIRDRWGMMLRYDSSTCWEVFPGFYENSRTRSYCHSWSSAPGYVFIKYILGVTPVEQGFNKVQISIPDVDITWCEGSIPSPHGRIDVWWSKENNKKRIFVKIPKNIGIIEKDIENWEITIERI